MPKFAPEVLTITENNPTTVTEFRVSVKLHSDDTEVAFGLYPITGVDTVIPIGSNGLFDSVADGTLIKLFVIEHAAPGHGQDGPEQEVPGNPRTVQLLCDGAEGFLVS